MLHYKEILMSKEFKGEKEWRAWAVLAYKIRKIKKGEKESRCYRFLSLLFSLSPCPYWIVKRAVRPNASGTKLIRGIMSSSGFQSSERLSGIFWNL